MRMAARLCKRCDCNRYGVLPILRAGIFVYLNDPSQSQEYGLEETKVDGRVRQHRYPKRQAERD